mmetsp:Transcript_17907/g.28010  ORF Transcript_17907/g.28010 Transcript_17907/m.28010 type:complete len:248 (-) Transcript_17907:18-761(-)|eukprot:CAMPEP_0201522672 /NCGR_PEP_ID=MMETSP0161_2-20130828/18485_1 /ASSEMBLY_ACC=CAM_ASM_000251 /TAXON_ID=180227 /ORGANISM="Neoparamoeba aestuarina, Strain SoJaBio B1-5/56/2" /LENGTH=247 /DNA_ID=CAMNT_0047921585 /DNA_START=37 /DNA_END=780 /DNA_ORIENTATION=+
MIFGTFSLLVGADPSLGKVDKSSFSQQTLMELFIGSFEPKENIYGSPENEIDILEWQGVDDNMSGGGVNSIFWNFFDLTGSLLLQWLPSTVEELCLTGNELSGSIRLEDLPPMLKELSLNQNWFTGSVQLVGLPESLQVLDLSNNDLCGTVDLDHLPKDLQVLHLSYNRFSGGISLKSIPKNMKALGLHNTEFSGNVSGHLCGLLYFNVSNTKLIGEVTIQIPRQNLRHHIPYKADNSQVTIIRETL